MIELGTIFQLFVLTVLIAIIARFAIYFGSDLR